MMLWLGCHTLPCVALGQQVPGSATPVRVAVVAYEDFGAETEKFHSCFARLMARDELFAFQLAVGTYSEVRHWLETRQVDLAVLTPGVFARTLTGPSQDEGGYEYLTSVLIPKPITEGSPASTVPDFRASYRSVCMVPADSTVESAGDLKRLIENQQAELLFVHPLSASGCIAPQFAMREAGIDFEASDVRFSYSHSQSIRMLTRKPQGVAAGEVQGKTPVAFVWDGAELLTPELHRECRAVAFEELRRLQIPHDVVVCRRGYAGAERLRQLLQEYRSDEIRFGQLPDWREKYMEVGRWFADTEAKDDAGDADAITLDGICQLLLQHARSQPMPPRLALVLSGGGAKCSYQVGAVSALEERLEKMRQEYPQYPLDIDLVVGTSGGAINSIPIAMGIPSSAAGRTAFAETWLELDQRDILVPSQRVRLNMGLWFALLQLTFLYAFVVRVTSLDRRLATVTILLILLAAMELLLARTRVPWSWLGGNHVVHHLWLWLSLGLEPAAWFLLALGGLFGLYWWRWRKGEQQLIRPSWVLRTLLILAIFILPLLQLPTILFVEETLSGGSGMERSIASNLTGLINRWLELEGVEPIANNAASPARQLQQTSLEAIQRGLLKRDLVITGSCLEQSSNDLPSDLYFYWETGAHRSPEYASRGVSLRKHPSILLDVVMGSGSIYPVFPAREVANVPSAGQSILLVDGGYSHNSPLEAAVQWGATHVVLIEATPRSEASRGSFAQNAAASFRHLHQQAQLLDARSRGKVNVFSLSPAPPHICVLDFASNLVQASITAGYTAASHTDSAEAGFRRELGQPVFSSIVRAGAGQQSTVDSAIVDPK